MSITVSFQASTLIDLKAQLAKFADQIESPAVAPAAPVPAPATPAATARKKRGRPAAALAEVVEVVETKTPAEVVPVPAPAAPALGIATKQDVVELMTTITKLEGGTEKAIGVLTSLGVKRISELKEDQYQAAVAACEALLQKK